MRGSFVASRAERMTCPPLLTSFVAAPQTALRLLGGALAMISAQWFAFVCPRVTHCLFRSSPPRNANLESKREFPPYFKRSAEMGGRKRAVIPVLKHGGPEKTHCFKNAGAFWGGHVPRSAKPATKLPPRTPHCKIRKLPHAKRQPRLQARVGLQFLARWFRVAHSLRPEAPRP